MGCCISKNKIDADYSNSLTTEVEKIDDETFLIRKKVIITENQEEVKLVPNYKIVRTEIKVKTMKKVTKKRMKEIKHTDEEEYTDEDQDDKKRREVLREIKLKEKNKTKFGKKDYRSCPSNYEIYIKMKKKIEAFENPQERKYTLRYKTSPNKILKNKLFASDDEIKKSVDELEAEFSDRRLISLKQSKRKTRTRKVHIHPDHKKNESDSDSDLSEFSVEDKENLQMGDKYKLRPHSDSLYMPKYTTENSIRIQEKNLFPKPFSAIKIVVSRPLYSFEKLLKEEIIYSYDIRERKMVEIKQNRIKTNHIENFEGNLNKSLVSITSNNILSTEFGLILKKLAFILTKGEINSKFMSDLNPEVKISFGNKSKTFYYKEKRIGSKKDELKNWNLDDTPNRDSVKDGDATKISQSFSQLDVSLNLSEIEDIPEWTPKKTPTRSISMTCPQTRHIPSPSIRKVSDFSKSLPRSTTTKLLDRNPFDLNENNSQIFTFEQSKSTFPLSHINIAKEQKENNFIYFSVSQHNPLGDKNILAEKLIYGEGYISILSILHLILEKSAHIYIPIFYQVENIQIAYLKLELPTNIPKVIEEEISVEEDKIERIQHLKLFSKKIVTIYEFRYYISIETMIVIYTYTERKLKAEIKEKVNQVISNKLSWNGLENLIQNDEKSDLIDETKYLMLVSSLNEILVELQLIGIFDITTITQMLKVIFLPFVYKKDLENFIKGNNHEDSMNMIGNIKRKLTNSLPRDKKIFLTDTILQFYVTIIEYYEEIIIYEEFSIEFIFFNFERKFYTAKENHHKIMLEYLKFFKIRKDSLKSLQNSQIANPQLNPITPPEQNPIFITNRNIIIKFMNIVNYNIKISIKKLKKKSINIFSSKKEYDVLKTKIASYFLHLGSKKNSIGISKYDFLLLFTDKQIIISILEILINFVRLGSVLGYKTKSNFFESADDAHIKIFFDYIFKNFHYDNKILNSVLLFVYELLYVLNEGKCLYDILKLINLKLLFSFFISHHKKINSKNFKNWIYFFSIISKITKLIKPSWQEHLDFIYLDWKFIFENISRLYILSFNNFTKIPNEKKISFNKNEKEISLQMFTTLNYLNKKFAIQIQMLFFDIFKDFMVRADFIKEFYRKSKKNFRIIFDQICFLSLLSFQDSHLIIAEKEMRRFYFKMLVTLMMILTKLRDECEIDFVGEFKLSLAAIVPNESQKLCNIMSVDAYLSVMIPKLKNLIDMNIFDDSTLFERKVTMMVNNLILNNK